MSDDRLARLHEILKDPLRQKILLQLGENDRLSFDSLMKNLKIEDPQELSNQLNALDNLIKKVKNEQYSQTEQGFSERPSEQYTLTEKGHYVLDEMIAFPELESGDYRQGLFSDSDGPSEKSKPKPKWFTAYWIAIFVSTAVILGIIFPVFGHVSFERSIYFLITALAIEGFGYYIRVKPPSIRINRVMYIVLIGGCLGCFFSIISIIFLSRIYNQINAYVIITFVACFALAGLIGDLIGKKRHYKGPKQYQP